MHESASADDIAALFAQIKPKAPVAQPVASTPKASQPDQQSSAAATADDIAALFATVKSGLATDTQSNPSPAKSNASSPPVAATPPGPAIPKGEALSELATPDDIESLFAALKK
jgi:hypothetical protein